MEHPASSRGSLLAALPQKPYLYALCSQDELGDYGRHILLVVDFVDHILQERLQWCHSLQDDPMAQESMLKDEENQPWPHLQSKSAPSVESAQRPHCRNSSSDALGRTGCSEQAGLVLLAYHAIQFKGLVVTLLSDPGGRGSSVTSMRSLLLPTPAFICETRKHPALPDCAAHAHCY